MTKLRVHELAKLINKNSKDVMGELKKQGVEVSSAMSSITQEQANSVKKSLGVSDTKDSVNKAAAAGKTDAGKAEVKKPVQAKEKAAEGSVTSSESKKTSEEAAKDGESPKKRISAVFRPQNASVGGSSRKGSGNNQKKGADERRRTPGRDNSYDNRSRKNQEEPAKANRRPMKEPEKANRRPMKEPEKANRRPMKEPEVPNRRPLPAQTAADRTVSAENRPVRQNSASQDQGSRHTDTSGRSDYSRPSSSQQTNRNDGSAQRDRRTNSPDGRSQTRTNERYSDRTQQSDRPGSRYAGNDRNRNDGTRSTDNRGAGRSYDNRGPVRSTDGRGPARPSDGRSPVRSTDGRGPARPSDGRGPVRSSDGRGPARSFDGRGPARSTDGRGPARSTDGRGPARSTDGRGPVRSSDGRGPARPSDGRGPNSQGDRRGPARPGDQNSRRPGDRDNRRPMGAGRDTGRKDAGKPAGVDLPAKPNQKQKGKQQNNKKYARPAHQENSRYLSKEKGKGINKPAPVKQEPKVPEIKTITVPEKLTIKELADLMKLQPSAIVKKLFLSGKVVTINQEINYDMAEEIAMEYEILCEPEIKIDVIAELLKEDDDVESTLQGRPPVVCVMGHVDHGKTSLLDMIRKTNVTAKEAGGITQHIGAYVVETNGQKITFLDTPGHEAFTAMRMRGAQSTDIAILVVAADDGVMPQTVEAINHAKAAGVEIIVAVNKIDKPSANIEKVKQELTEYELIPEDWGGSTIFVPVSAHTGEGISNLLEMIILASDVLELKANPNRNARGLVIEAELDKGKGPVATVLVQKGTLKVGDSIAAGSSYGKVRAMMDDKGRRVKEAGPSVPVEILGLSDVPGAGEIFVSLDNEKEARSFAETFISEGREKLLEDTKAKLSLDDLFTQIQTGNIKELGLILKADVQGSVEAIKQSLLKLSNEEVMIKIIHGGVGAINESDVMLASASNAIIIGFNVRPDATAKITAEHEKVDIRLYKVIYKAIEDIESAMKGMLDPVFEEQVTGHAVVRQLFKASGIGTIAGSYITDGKIVRGSKVRVSREGDQIFEGNLASLKRFKDDVKEVAKGYECGLVFEDFNDIREEDTVEAYIMVEVPR